MSEAYLKKVKKWEGELSNSTPRKVRLKLGVIALLTLLLIFIWLLLDGITYFVFSALLNVNADHAGVVALFPLFIILIVFVTFGSMEMKSVQSWKKVTGRIDAVYLARRSRVYDVGYEFNGNVFRKRISENGGLSKGDSGDPVLLLINPEKPNSCLSYGGSAWKALNEDETNLVSS